MNRPLCLDDFATVAPAWAAAVQSPAFDGTERWLAFLQPRGELLDLVLFDCSTRTSRVALRGEPPAGARPLAETLARERGRVRYSGVTHCRWLPEHAVVFCLLGDRLVFVHAESGAVHEYRHESGIDHAEPSPRGDAIAFASGHQLWRLALDGGVPRTATRLTDDGTPLRQHAAPDPVTAEELFNGAACVWSKDASRLMFASFDVSAVWPAPVPGGTQAVPETSAYGLPGAAVATFGVSLMQADGSGRRNVLEADPAWPYFLGFASRNAEEAVLMRLRRDQTTLQWLRIRWDDGAVSLLLERTQQPWINAPGKPVFRAADGAFFSVHESSGTGCVGLFDAEGRWQRDIGTDAGHVESLAGLDAEGQGLYFVATGGDARERHLFHAGPGDGWISHRLTQAPGVHGATMAHRAGLRLMTVDTLDAAPAVQLQAADGTCLHRFDAPALPYDATLAPPRLVDVLAADGSTVLHAAVYDPPADAPAPRPVVLLVYGGPHGQAIRRSRQLTLDLRAQWLAAQGYFVVKVDNRGTNARGLVFEQPLYGRMGTVEVDDQCAALDQLLPQLPGADRGRIGVVGWSYGGYMALRCLQRRPDLFAAAVAGAPVVNWEDYDAPYTERYMGSPVESPYFAAANAEGYRASAADVFASGPPRPLLLIHGLNDENVLFRHSAALIERLAARRVPYELLLVPDERHLVRAAHQRTYLEWRIQDFFDRALKGGTR